jgi:hypothetical protein
MPLMADYMELLPISIRRLHELGSIRRIADCIHLAAIKIS